jgi:hypothetical protein
MSDARTGIITVRFRHRVAIAERIHALATLDLTVVERNDPGASCDVAVPDGTQWEWSHRIADLPGVVSVGYSRPRSIADN